VILDLNSYFMARSTVINLGQPLLYFTFILSTALIIFSLYPPLRSYLRYLNLAVFSSLLAGFLLLGWYHYRIYLNLPLYNPISGALAGRYAIPVWIEDEKLYFWTLLLSLWLLVIRSRNLHFKAAVNIALTIFITLTTFTSNPFISPLPGFNKEIIQYSQTINNVDINGKYQLFGMAIGRMQGFYNSIYMWIHPPLLFLAYSTFVISFFAIIFMLLNHEHDFDRLAYNWAKPGYIVLTIGLLLGYPWAVEAWKGQPWWYSPKINVTLMMWVLYTAYFHSRLYLHRRGMWKTTGIIGLLAFTSVIATYLSTYVLPGIHSVGG